MAKVQEKTIIARQIQLDMCLIPRTRKQLVISLLILAGIIWFLPTWLGFTESVHSDNYGFDIEVTTESGNVTYLHDFLFKYDFSKDEGNISFRLADPDFKSLRIGFPTNVTNGSLLVKTFHCIREICEDVDLNFTTNKHIQNYDSSALMLYNPQGDLNRHIIFNILFEEEDLDPAGSFRFWISGARLHFSGSLSAELVIGNKYECAENCFRNYLDTEEHYLSEPGVKRIAFEREKNQYIFTLQTTDRIKRRILQGFDAVALAILVGAIFLHLRDWYNRLEL